MSRDIDEHDEQDRNTDDDKAGLQAADGTPTGSLEDPEERPSQAGILGGSKPHTDTRPSDPVPHEEVKPGMPTRHRS